MAVRKIQTKRRCICYTRKASKNEENLRTQAHDVESVRITRLDDGEKLRKREYSRELLSIYGEEKGMDKKINVQEDQVGMKTADALDIDYDENQLLAAEFTEADGQQEKRG